MKIVTTREAQHHLAKVIAMVEAGEEVVLTRRGKKILRLERYHEPSEKPTRVPNFRALRERIGTVEAGGKNAVLAERNEHE